MGASSSSGVADTKLYDLLQVAPDATASELGKAYKKRALRLHPDKGGDPVEFNAMKDAYDVLSDPEKRKAYDKYGPHIIPLINGEGPPSMEAMIALVKGITQRERFAATLAVLAVAVFAMSPVIMISLRWDEDNHMDWACSFVPLWLIETVALFLWLSRQNPDLSENEPNMDDETRDMYAEMKAAFQKQKIFGASVLLLLIIFEGLVAAKLRGTLTYSWFMVFVPWMTLEVILLVHCIAHAPDCFFKRDVPQKFEYFVLQRLSWGFARMLTCSLVALRASEIYAGSWFTCLIPLVAAAAIEIIREAWEVRKHGNGSIKVGVRVRIDGLQARPELNGQEGLVKSWDKPKGRWSVQVGDGKEFQVRPTNLKVVVRDVEEGCLEPGKQEETNSDDDRMKKQPRSQVPFLVCKFMMWLPWFCVAACKLDGWTCSAFLIFTPMILLTFCVTCYLSCFLMCITPEMIEQQLAAAQQNPSPQTTGRPDDLATPLLKETVSG